MKMAQGYVTDDGTFFESKLEAVLYEAELKLMAQLATEYPQIGAGGFLEIVQQMMPALKGYIDAYEASYSAARHKQAEESERDKTNGSQAPEVVESGGHVSSTEEDLASLLKLPARRPLHVPNVGSGSHAEAVPERRPEHGAGGG